MKALLILSMLILSGCGRGVTTLHVEMPDDVQTYYYEYFQIVGMDKQTSGKIVVEQTQDGTEATCRYTFGDWKIQLSPAAWDYDGVGPLNQTDYRRALVFHELTHCIFHSDKHSTDRNSYMYNSANGSLTESEIDAQVLDYTSHL